MVGSRGVRRVGRVGALACALLWLAGCGGGSRPKTVPISGRVTINGQPPNESGRLHFTPTQTAEGYPKRPAGGAFAPDGVYRVMSWEPDDGLVPGHYTVSLMPGDLSKTAIPVKYRQSGSSGLEVDVPIDESSIEFNIDVRTN